MKKHRRAVTFFRQKSYLLAAVLMLAAVFGMTGVYVSEQRSEKKQQEQLAAREQQEQLAAQQREEESTAVDQVILPENSDFMDEPDVVSSKEDADGEDNTDGEDTPDEAAAKENEPEKQEEESTQETAAGQVQPELHFDAAAEMGWPLKGNVIMNYSMDQTVYFATLDQYKYNPAIIIQGNVNDKVAAVADGKISNIETNEVTGCTVTVDLGDGYSAVYGQLKEVPLSAGDYMEAGDIVGYVNEPTKYYSVEGPNLYFEMIKDNASVDPMEFLQ